MAHIDRTEAGIYMFAGSLLVAGAFLFYSQRGTVRDRALVRGEVRELDDTVGVVLRSRRDATRYQIFHRGIADSAVAGGELRFRGAATLSDVAITAEPGRVKWRAKARDYRSAPGINVHLRARVTVPANAAQTEDTLALTLPGLLPLAMYFADIPVFFPKEYPSATTGETSDIRRFTVYESRAALERSMRTWSLFALACLVPLALLVAHIARRLLAGGRPAS
ncbi:MAG: hypothetical protein ABJD07_15170 [Gemmatimonadaceae bacterium]